MSLVSVALAVLVLEILGVLAWVYRAAPFPTDRGE